MQTNVSTAPKQAPGLGKSAFFVPDMSSRATAAEAAAHASRVQFPDQCGGRVLVLDEDSGDLEGNVRALVLTDAVGRVMVRSLIRLVLRSDTMTPVPFPPIHEACLFAVGERVRAA